MATFKNLFPPNQSIVLVFASCVVPIYSWSILAFLKKVPSWLIFLRPWDLISIFAYSQAFALLESAIFLLVLILLSMILPARLFRHRFVAQGSVVMFLAAIYALVFQFKSWTDFSSTVLFLGAVLYLVLNGVAYVLVKRYKRLEQAIHAFVEQLTVLLYFYVPVTLVSVIIVIARNI